MLVSKNSLWQKAQTVELKIDEGILPEFSLWFDKKIPENTKKELIDFVVWMEDNFRIPITLSVEFEYRHYLVSKKGERVGFIFYWSDFSPYPVFGINDSLPLIRLPVRTEYYTIEEILSSFLTAIAYYYAWLCNEMHEEYTLDEQEIEDILQKYLSNKSKEQQGAL